MLFEPFFGCDPAVGVKIIWVWIPLLVSMNEIRNDEYLGPSWYFDSLLNITDIFNAFQSIPVRLLQLTSIVEFSLEILDIMGTIG